MENIPLMILLTAVPGLLTAGLTFAFCGSNHVEDDGFRFKHFQTKTLYNTVRGRIRPSSRPSGCSVVSIVMVLRHGSRHPGASAANQFQALLHLQSRINTTGTATMCFKDLKRIKDWKNWFNASLDKHLAITGVAEMKGLGERFAAAFPELFSNETEQRFISSDTQRAMESARVFRDSSYLSRQHSIEINDRLIRSYKYCQRYAKQVVKNKNVSEDLREFMEGIFVTNISNALSDRLGVSTHEISNRLAEIVNKKGCAEEEWATGKESPWCLALTSADHRVFEYGEDMEDYYKKSYGIPVSHKQSCQLKHYILSALENATTGAPENHFLFGHSLTLFSVLTEMGLIEDDGPFRSEDYPAKLNRKFRASILAPGSGNVAFVLYRCSGDIKLQIFHNEHLLKLPMSDSRGLSSLEKALNYFGHNDPNDCQWNDICSEMNK